jgi:hypothetical protein
MLLEEETFLMRNSAWQLDSVVEFMTAELASGTGAADEAVAAAGVRGLVVVAVGMALACILLELKKDLSSGLLELIMEAI